jgi:hypothetical protein
MNFKARHIILVIPLILFYALDVTLAQSSWELKRNKQGIKVFTRTSPNSQLDEFKGIAVVHASVEDILELLSRVPEMVDWVPDCTSAELLYTNNTKQIHYATYSAPWPVSHRDSYIEYHYVESKDANRKVIFKAVPDYGPEKSPFVRVPEMAGFWFLKYISDTKTEVTYQVRADAGGSVPAWLTNAAAVDTPYNTLNGLKAYLEE